MREGFIANVKYISMQKNLHITIIFISIFIGVTNLVPAQTIIASYYRSWTNLPAPDKLEFNNLTHIIQAFAFPDTVGSVHYLAGVPNQNLIQAAHLANKKILLSFGGQANSDGFGIMTADSIHRRNFINNVVNILSLNNYDGIDIDWEYPSSLQGKQFTVLVTELRQKFDSLKSSWLITLAVPATSYYGQNYQYENMINYVDWFSIMTYGYHGAFSSHSGPIAPLYQSPLDNDGAVSFSVGYMYYTRKIPQNKLLLGIPFFGIRFNTSGLYQPFTGDVPDLSFSDAMDSLQTGGWNYNWDSVSSVPYLQNNSHTGLITFDDTMSVRLKTDYAFSKNLGGVMVWALDQDIINGKEPLLETIENTIKNHIGTSIENEPLKSPYSFILYNNYPNPFNPSTIIKFSMSENTRVKLIIYDVLGRVIETLLNDSFTVGIHSVSFDGSNLPSGIYLYVLSSGTKAISKKMILLK
jgi:chitinase